MTNEALAALIQQGDNDELLPLLWDKTSKLIFQKIGRYWELFGETFRRFGYELADIRQEGYNALLYAVKQYDINKPYQFTTYLNYAIKNTLRGLLRGKADTLNQSGTVSLDQPVSSEDDSSEFCLSDIVSDERAAQEYTRIDELDKFKALHDAVDSLPDRERNVIHFRYFDELTLKQSGEKLGISLDGVRRIEANALRLLRTGKIGDMLREIYGDEYSPRYFVGYSRHKGLAAFRTSGSSEVEDYVLHRLYKFGS